MKKKILIIIAIIIVIALGGFGYLVYFDIKQEENLIAELNGISDLANSENINMDEINQRLDRTITKGDYATVEKAFKNYLRDNFNNTLKIAEILNDDKIIYLLTAENYKEDGKEFTETKKYITTTREDLNNCKKEYVDFFTKEKAMSYIEDKGLDSYYIDFYMDEFVGNIEAEKTNDTVENSIDDIIELLNISEEVIGFLIENKDSWQVEGDNIVFDSESLSNKYDEMINKLL